MASANDTDQFQTRPGAGGYDRWPAVTTTGSALGGQVGAGKRKWWRPSLFSEVRRWSIVAAIWIPVTAFLLLLSLFVAIYWQSRLDQTRPVDAIVVLGTAQYDGRPSPTLQARLDEVLVAWNKGVAPLIVVTGGRQQGDRFTEAEASRNYLMDHGVPRQLILLENEGHTTWQSMQGADKILESKGAKRILLVSDGFHIFRLKMMTRHLGLSPYGDPATNSPIRQGSVREVEYMVREGGGVLEFLWNEVL